MPDRRHAGGGIRRRSDEAAFAIINADIRIASPFRDVLMARLEDLAADGFLIGQRTDVTPSRAGGVRETVFRHGFDFLALRRHWIDQVLPFLAPSLAFGRPWWDHYLPLALIARGVRPHLIAPGTCRHDVHENAWNWRHYCAVGTSAGRSFQAAAERLDARLTLRRWLDATNAEFGPFMPTACVDLLRVLALREPGRVFLTASFLKRQAAANVRLILRSAADAAPGQR